jgi:hypothetical protein
MPTITIDGPNRLIRIGFDAAETVVDAGDLYSEWKRWVLLGNSQYVPAFGESVGGNPLGGGVDLGSYYFLNNAQGWRIEPANQDHTLIINGELYPTDSGSPFIEFPFADVLVRLSLSSATQRVETGISGLTPGESATLSNIETIVQAIQSVVDFVTKILRNRRETNPSTGRQTIYDDDSTSVLIEGDLFEDVAGTQPYQGQGADRADRME